jgi:glutathione S-transferase
MIRLFSAQGCPYAHRTRSLLTLLNEPFEVEEINLANKPAHFLALSPTGRVPMMQDEGLLLYESAIINEYLTEKRGWAGAWPSDLGLKARQRLAMVQWDSVVIPAFFGAMRDRSSLEGAAGERVHRELGELEKTVKASGGPECLLGLHLAPFWLRMGWLREDTPLVGQLEQRLGTLARWLDAAVALPAVQKTAPDRATTVELTRRKFGPQAAAR